MIFCGLSAYGVITLLAFRMDSAREFVLLGGLVATVQGGTQALSRSLFASLIPSFKSGEYFAFFSIGEKFAGALGPAMYGGIIYLTGSDRWAILSILFFFVAGAAILTRVRIEEGKRTAREAEASYSI